MGVTVLGSSHKSSPFHKKKVLLSTPGRAERRPRGRSQLPAKGPLRETDRRRNFKSKLN